MFIKALEYRGDAQESEPDKMSPRQVLRAIQDGLPKNAMVSTDIGNICAMANSYLPFEEPRSFLAPGMFGNCGYAFPSIMGAKLARSDRPAVALVGDGAFIYCCSTAALWAASFYNALT